MSGLWQLFLLTSLLEFSFGGFCGDTGTIVPLYLYPHRVNGVHNWQPLIDVHTNFSSVPVWVIVNVYNGPGPVVDTNYEEAITMLKSSGINTLGYVHTSYGKRDQESVKREIDQWKKLYQPTGIFFDEMASEYNRSLATYYSQLKRYAKQHGFNYTVGNPGNDVHNIYVNTMDTIVIWEESGFPTIEQYCGWHVKYPRSKWAILPYNLGIDENREKLLSAKNCVGFIYLTDDGGDNPWDTLPPYLPELFYKLNI